MPARAALVRIVGFVLVLAGLARPAQAQNEPSIKPPKPYSAYERETIAAALANVHGERDPEPQGKVVERIDIVPLDVFEPRDPIPRPLLGLVNAFHATTRPYIIAREVLMRPGDRYDQALADESARNLRNLNQLSLVLVVPVRGNRPDSVRVLVITKDVWSLRLNSDFRFAGGRLEYLVLQPAEQNILGLHQQVNVKFFLQPETYALGGGYDVPRVGGSRIALHTDMSVIVNRARGEIEGTTGLFSYGQPLYAIRTKWAWQAAIQWKYEIARRYSSGKIYEYDAPSTEGMKDGIPWRYRSEEITGVYTVTRSFGIKTKHNVTLGMSADRNVYRAPDLSEYDPRARAEFVRAALPVSDTRIGPYMRYDTFSTRFMTVLDMDILGLQEDYRLGHELNVRVGLVSRALSSSRDFVDVTVAGGYTVPLGDGFARLFATSSTEIAADNLPDASLEVQARVASPRTPAGRLVFDARLINRYRNYLNLRTTLGGDGRLRGYPTKSFIGKDLIAANLEFRSRPLELLKVQLGGVLFFDVGDAFDGFDEMRVKQSVGVGARILFPQFDRVVMRLDWGIPLSEGYLKKGAFPGDVVVTFRQAFATPTLRAGN